MKTLRYFNEFVEEIMSSNSRLHKQSVLNKYKDDEIIRKYLQIAFDPFKVYGISTKKLNKRIYGTSGKRLNSVFDLFDYLEKNNTGTAVDILACQEMLARISVFDTSASQLLKSLICKDLSIGCDSKTINKEIPGLISTFEVQLANKYFDKPEYVEGKEFAITTKIDGGRIIAIKENNQVSFYTRAGQKYEGLVEIERIIAMTMPNNIVLDGELTIFDNQGIPSKEAYKRAMKISRSDGEKRGLKMLVFDAMPLEDFRTQNSRYTWAQRRKELEERFKLVPPQLDMLDGKGFPICIELLPVLYQGTDTSKITELLNKAIANQEEGIMINICDAKYEFKRTNSLLKVKKMQTMDLEIIGFEEGEGRLAGTLGAILVRYKNGNVVKVGSGFSDDIRTEIWNNQSNWLGSICEIQYFEETTNADGGISLRFPVFKDRRTDKTEADY
jgi:DNA ligase-1